MKVSVLTVFSELYNTFLQTSLVGRAQDKGAVSFDIASFFSYVAPKERIDAPIFGPGAGMVIKPKVIEKAVQDKEALHGKAFKIFFSPQGKKLDQELLRSIAQKMRGYEHLMLLPARYEGMDARVESHYADETVSVGDFVVMGGDLPAMLFLEAFLRLIPGVVGKQVSVEQESFSGPFVDYPVYTEPVEWKGMQVPDVVRSGNHAAIDQWRHEKAVQQTVRHHFDWLRTSLLSAEQKAVAKTYIPAHYCAVMHTDVLIGSDAREGTTSVTTIDIHDSARSAATYGIKNTFIVTPLKDQQHIVTTLLDFWHTGVGRSYNKSRSQAVDQVRLAPDLDAVMAAIREKEGKEPLVIATSARSVEHPGAIHWDDQEQVWSHDRPVLLLFGTGQGLSEEVIQRVDYLLDPIEGFSDFTHLSVRTAIGIALDRWLGILPKR